MNSILLKGVFSAGVSFDSKMWKIATRFFFFLSFLNLRMVTIFFLSC